MCIFLPSSRVQSAINWFNGIFVAANGPNYEFEKTGKKKFLGI